MSILRFPYQIEQAGETPWGDEYRYHDLYLTGSEAERIARSPIVRSVIMLPADVIWEARRIIARGVWK